MAGEGPANMIARRVTDDLISFSGETAPPKFMKFFLVQKVADSRRSIRKEQGYIDLYSAMTLFGGVTDAKRGKEGKLLTLNKVIAEALDEIETQEKNVEILDGIGDDV
ncbi:hypothetical protein Tco_1085786 [Tanacetum coccineum]